MAGVGFASGPLALPFGAALALVLGFGAAEALDATLGFGPALGAAEAVADGAEWALAEGNVAGGWFDAGV